MKTDNPTDKEKIWNKLQYLETEIDMVYSSHLDSEMKDSISAQIGKSRRMLQEAKTAQDYKVVESRLQKLHDWLRHRFDKTE